MTLHSPLWQQNSSYPAQLDRQLIAALIGTPGRLRTTDLWVSQHAGGANMSVDVSVGNSFVEGTDISDQGQYLCWSDAVVNLAVAAAPGTGLSRVDLVVATVRDADADAGVNNDWIIQVVEGTPSSSAPAVPTAPVSSLELAAFAVGANVTSIVNGDIVNLPGVAAPIEGFGVRGVPAGRMYFNGTQTILNFSTTDTQVTPMATDYAKNGMTVVSSGLVIPDTGTYTVSAAVQWQGAGSPPTNPVHSNGVVVCQNGTRVRLWVADVSVDDTFAGASGSDDIALNAGDVLTLEVFQQSGVTMGMRAGAEYTWLTARLASI